MVKIRNAKKKKSKFLKVKARIIYMKMLDVKIISTPFSTLFERESSYLYIRIQKGLFLIPKIADSS